MDNAPLLPTRAAQKNDMLQHTSPVDLRHGEKAGIDGGTQRRLFRGDVLIDARLDLHGMTAMRAHKQLIKFIGSAADDGCRCVLVITGKGSGVLNGHVPTWLKQLPVSPMFWHWPKRGQKMEAVVRFMFCYVVSEVTNK